MEVFLFPLRLLFTVIQDFIQLKLMLETVLIVCVNGILVRRIKVCLPGNNNTYSDPQITTPFYYVLYCYLLRWQNKHCLCIYFVTVTCEPLYIHNGYIEYNTKPVNGVYRFPTVATYKCNSGYNRVGDLFRTCMDYNSWTNHKPRCDKSN